MGVTLLVGYRAVRAEMKRHLVRLGSSLVGSGGRNLISGSGCCCAVYKTRTRQDYIALLCLWRARGSAAKVSDFIRTVRILKVSFYAYFTCIRIFRTISLYIKYRTIRIFFRFFTVELRIFPERSWQHCRGEQEYGAP